MLAELILDLKIIELDKNDYAAKVGCWQPLTTIPCTFPEVGREGQIAPSWSSKSLTD